MSSAFPSPSQKRYRPSYSSDAAEALARPAKRQRGGSLTPDGLICDRNTPVTPARGDLARPLANFHSWNKERVEEAHETVVAGQHESTNLRSHAPFQHRSYESRILRVSGSVAAPASTVTLLDDRRGATGPRLPQGCSAYISHAGWKSTALSVLPADGCAMPAFSGQIDQLHNSPFISDSYHSISKSDTVLEGRMFRGITPSSVLYGEHADSYIDFGLAPVELATDGEYGYHDASYTCATLTQPLHTSQRRSSSSSDSSFLSTPRLYSPLRELSNSPPSTIEELSTPNVDNFEYINIMSAQEQFMSLTYRDENMCHSVKPAAVAVASHSSYPNTHPEQGVESIRPDTTAYLAGWLADCATALADQQTSVASTSTAHLSQSSVSALPPSAFIQLPLSAPAVMPDLQHPRPRRAYIPPWQTETEFDLKQFVKSPRPELACPAQAAAQQGYLCYTGPSHAGWVFQEDIEEEEFDEEDQDAMEEDWEFEDDVEEDQSMEVEPGLQQHCSPEGLSNTSLEIDVGPGMGLGFSTRPLDSQSLLYQPVPDYVRCPDAATYVPSFGMENYAFSFAPSC